MMHVVMDSSEIVARYGVDPSTAEVLAHYRFDSVTFDRLRSELAEFGLDPRRNWVTGQVDGPASTDLLDFPPAGSADRTRWHSLGAGAIERGEVAVMLLAGGMATRFGGGVKALADVLPGLRFIDVKLADLVQLTERMQTVVPMVLMTSFQSDEVLRSVAGELENERVPVHVAPQSISMRVTEQGELFTDADGAVSLYAPGHGDVPWALRNSGLLGRLAADGVRHLFVTNVDNAAATLDPAIVGAHIEAGRQMTCEVTGGDLSGGAPYFVDGHLQILEGFRIPDHVDTASPLAVNTNSMVLDLGALDAEHPLTWFQVQKKVGDEPVVQFERLVGELSAFLTTSMVVVQRDGSEGRFQPVKDPNELETRRPQIQSILEDRGLL